MAGLEETTERLFQLDRIQPLPKLKQISQTLLMTNFCSWSVFW